jgi:hypothetical protein
MRNKKTALADWHWQGKLNYSKEKENLSEWHLSTKSSTCAGLGSNPGPHDERPILKRKLLQLEFIKEVSILLQCRRSSTKLCLFLYLQIKSVVLLLQHVIPAADYYYLQFIWFVTFNKLIRSNKLQKQHYMHFHFKTPPVPHILQAVQQTHKQVRNSSEKSVPFMTLSSERFRNPWSRH